MGKNDYLIRRLCIDGMFVGLYVVLAYSLNFALIGTSFRISFAAICVILAALLYGVGDALVIALIGEFVLQLLNYGVTITTPLWILPSALRALVLGIPATIFLKKGDRLQNHFVLYLILSLVAALLVTAANTGVSFLDAAIFGYPYPFVLATNAIRLGISLGSAVLMFFVSLPLVRAVAFIVYPESRPVS